MKIPVNNSPLFWHSGSFQPEGPLDIVTSESELGANPFNWKSKDTWAARIIVGFKRKGKRALTLNRLVTLVRQLRTEQVGDPAATFVSQRGIYKHQTPRGEIVDEPGAQIIIINTPNLGTTPRAFVKQMEELSEDIATELDQEEVIVEIQRNGLTQRSWGMGPRKR